MAKFIDADRLLQRLTTINSTVEQGIKYYNSVYNLVNEQPAADVVEVKRGHWIEDEVCVYACSECGFTFTSAEDISEFKYCRCGADMRGDEK